MKNKNKNLRLPSYGGQALIEGVLMRSKQNLAAAMRSPDGKIIVVTEQEKNISRKLTLYKPFLRGLVVLWDSLIIGMKYLTISANIQSNEEEKIDGTSIVFAVVIAIGFAIILYFITPTLLADFFARLFHTNSFISNIMEGLFRLLTIIVYLSAVSLSKDIQRVYAYHGAEHKTINAYESNAELNIPNVMEYSISHAQCGTSFLLTLIVLSIIVFSLMGDLSLVSKIISRISFIPLLAMLSYEIIHWMGRHMNLSWVRLLALPNLALQKLTTREPDAKMVEVAIKAFSTLLEMENHSR